MSKSPNYASAKDRKLQQITRIPPYRPGDWVLVSRHADSKHRGGIYRIKSLFGGFTSPDQTVAAWRIIFEDGTSIPPEMVYRMATEPEVEAALRRRQ